jgi:hypothetical protein
MADRFASTRHLVSTPAKAETCPGCRAALLVALDEGLTARVDATPLPDRPAEIAALLAGRRTYTRLRNNELVHRDADRIADPRLRGDIHAQHQCTGPAQGELF